MSKKTQVVTEPTVTPQTPTVPVVVQPATPPSSPVQSVYAQEDVYAPDGKLWKAKFHGAQGYLKQKEAGFLTEEGALKAQLEAAQQAVAEHTATIASLQGNVTSLTETSGTIPALQEEIGKLKLEAAKASKYQIAMRYPALLSIKVEEEVPVPEGQEGEPTKRTVNPVLDLIESSGLDGPTLEMTLQRMVAAMPEVGAKQTLTPSPVTPSSPAPAVPAGDDKQAWIAKAKEAQQRLNSGDTTGWADFEEATSKIRELEVLEVSGK